LQSQGVDKLTLGYEFILLQIGISIVGYIVHQYSEIPFQRILGAATALSIISPLLMLDLKTVDLPLATAMIQNYVLIVPEQIVGFLIGSVVTVVIHGLKSILAHFDIQIR